MTRASGVVFLLSLLSMGCSGPSAIEEAVPERGADTLEIGGTVTGPWTAVFYNVENLFDTLQDRSINDWDFTPDGALHWNATRYATKLAHLAEAISWTGSALPRLIGLAEVENAQVVDELARTGALVAGNYTVLHFDSPDERGIDVALLVRDAEVLGAEAIPVDLGRDRTRDILHATLVLDNEVWQVYVNHWPSRREGPAESGPKRMTAARTLRRSLDALDLTDHVLIMGDFNDAPDDPSIKEGLGASCIRTAALVDLMCLDQPVGHGSHNFKGEWAYLDQFIVDRRTLGRVGSAQAYWDDRLLFKHPRYGRSPDKTYSGNSYKGGYSDHLPIVMEIR